MNKSKIPQRAPTTPANLYAGAKSFALAMRKLYTPDVATSALSMPFYHLSGFSLELSLKSIVLVTGASEAELRALGHDLSKCYESALHKGYKPNDPLWLGRMIESMTPPHVGFELRYVPDKTLIDLPKPDILMKVIGDHLDEVEDQFPVWGDDILPTTSDKP